MKRIIALCALLACLPAEARQAAAGCAAARAEYQRLQGRGVPVILVGTQRMNRYGEDRLAQMLKGAGY